MAGIPATIFTRVVHYQSLVAGARAGLRPSRADGASPGRDYMERSAVEPHACAAQIDLIPGPKLLSPPVAGWHVNRSSVAEYTRAEFAGIVANAVFAVV